MLIEAMLQAVVAEFKRIVGDFCTDPAFGVLTPEAAEAVSRTLTTALSAGGAAAYRAYLLGVESQDDRVFAEGEWFRFKGVRNKAFLTAFGEVTVPRRCYQNAQDTKSYVPLDAAWGMQGQYMDAPVREAVLFASAHVTPEETAQLLAKCASFRPHATAIKHVLSAAGELVETHRVALDEAVRAEESAPEGVRALVASMDGATILLKEKGEQFGRPAERPRGGEKVKPTTAYRVAMVGCVSHYGAPDETTGAPNRLQSRYAAHMPEFRCPTFKARFEAELDHAEATAPPGAARVLLLDAAPEIWNYVDHHPRFDGYHKCIDYWHAVEHLSVAAEALFPGLPKKATAWYDKYRRLLKESDDGAEKILRSIAYYAPQRKRSATSAKHLGEQRTYFTRNGHRMPYATFKKNGWPIGSGPVEAACKSLIKTRMGRSGMRWSRPGGQHVLALRTYVKSNRWEAAWPHIKKLHYAPCATQ